MKNGLKISPQSYIPLDEWPPPSEQTIQIGAYKYRVEECISATKGLDVFDLSLRGFNLGYDAPNSNSLRDFVRHVVAVAKADLKFPIILAPSGEILDGRHRVAKAILQGSESILAVQLKEWPEGEYQEEGKE